MSTISEKLSRRLEQEAENKSRLKRINDCNEKLKSLGVSKTPSYKIDPIDTIGFKVYKSK